mgnify:CR=1 FL=1
MTILNMKLKNNPKSLSKRGEKNPNWLGVKVSYKTLHQWVRRNKKWTPCVKCEEVKNVDAANISGEYKRILNDWEWLCRSFNVGFSSFILFC